MTAPSPGAGRRAIRPLILRTLPERLAGSRWCGRHPRERTVPVLRAGWVCLDCVREQAGTGGG